MATAQRSSKGAGKAGNKKASTKAAGVKRTSAKKVASKTSGRNPTGRVAKRADTAQRASHKVRGARRASGVATGFGAGPRTEFVRDVLGGTRTAADMLGVAPSQASRWISGESTPGPSQARILVDLEYVLARLMILWADVDLARDWLETPNAHLDGIRPADWIRARGATAVVEAIQAEAAGAYA